MEDTREIESDDSDDECSSDESCAIREQLAEWAVRFNTPHTSLSALLKILKQRDLDVPLDARTLLVTPKNIVIENKAGGQYYYCGVENAIKKKMMTYMGNMNDADTLTLHVNIDGIPLSRSSKISLWPILGKIQEMSDLDPFVIAVFAGTEKPTPVGEFLYDFVEEIKILQECGITCNNKYYQLVLDAIICDAPARSMIKCIKGHSGYNACERCTEHGTYVENRVTLPGFSAPERTDSSFKEQTDEDHHTSFSFPRS